MRKCFGLWAAAIGMAGLAAASGQAAPKADAGGLRQTMSEIAAAAGRNDCKTIARLGVPVLDRQTAGLPADVVAELYDLVVGCEWDAGATERAYAHTLRGTALE